MTYPPNYGPPQQYRPPPQYRPIQYGPPPGWQPPVNRQAHIAITVLYLVAAPLPIITAVVFGEYLATAWSALWDGNINGPGLVLLLSIGLAGLLGVSCLSNGLVRLVRGRRWNGGAWSALVFATLSAAGIFAMIALMAGQDVPMIGQIALYFVGSLIAVVAAMVGAFSRK